MRGAVCVVLQAMPLGNTSPRRISASTTADAAAVASRPAKGRYPWSKGFPVPRSYTDYLVVKAGFEMSARPHAAIAAAVPFRKRPAAAAAAAGRLSSSDGPRRVARDDALSGIADENLFIVLPFGFSAAACA